MGRGSVFFFFKQKTAYEMRISDWSSDVCSSDLRHRELFYAVPGIGAVLHTANPRLSDEQLSFTINHAGSTILFFDSNQLPVIARLAPRLTNIRSYVMMAPADQLADNGLGAFSYETILAAQPETYAWPEFHEMLGAFTCSTSGTTGEARKSTRL